MIYLLCRIHTYILIFLFGTNILPKEYWFCVFVSFKYSEIIEEIEFIMKVLHNARWKDVGYNKKYWFKKVWILSKFYNKIPNINWTITVLQVQIKTSNQLRKLNLNKIHVKLDSWRLPMLEFDDNNIGSLSIF